MKKGCHANVAVLAVDLVRRHGRLVLDALIGDPTLFIRFDEVSQCWRIIDPIIGYWADDSRAIPLYEAASCCPTEADRLLERDGRAWRDP